MKKLCYLTLLPMLCIFFNAKAQQFLNGSLEPKGTITPCTAVPIATYNSNMSNAWIVGPASTVINSNSSCSSGAGVAGSYYTGLKCTISGPPPNGTQNNKLILKLDKPMIPGTTYKVTYSRKLDAGASYVHMGGAIACGYTKDSTTTDSFSVMSFGFSNMSWVALDTFKITPKISTQYIWFEAGFDGAAGTILIHVDDFKVLPVPASVPGSLESTMAEAAVKVFPNPFTNRANIILDGEVALPCTMSIYDISGREVRKQIVNEKRLHIDRDQLGNGIYFLQVVDNNNRKFNSKLAIE